MTDDEWLVCVPVLPGVRVVKGSHTRRCALCNGYVWVAPSGLQMLRERPACRIGCVPCIGRVHVYPLPLNPTQLAEIREAFDERPS